MDILHVATGHAFEKFGSVAIAIGLLFTAYELHHGFKAHRIANLLAIQRQHLDIWAELYSHPELERVLDPDADLSAHPISRKEKLFVQSLIMHLGVVFRASKEKMLTAPTAMPEDIRQFFALPIPAHVWRQSRIFQEPDFVKFVEATLEQPSSLARQAD